MALTFKLNPESIVECVPYNRDIPSISKEADRGYIYLHALYDTWLFPLKYRDVTLNINKIYLPDNCIGVISTMPQVLYPNLIDMKMQVIPMKHFPNGIKMRNGYGILPYKIHAGDKVAILHMIPITDTHVVVLESYT